MWVQLVLYKAGLTRRILSAFVQMLENFTVRLNLIEALKDPSTATPGTRVNKKHPSQFFYFSGRWKHFWMGVDVELTTGSHQKLTKNVNPNFSFDWILFIIVGDVSAEIGMVFIEISFQLFGLRPKAIFDWYFFLWKTIKALLNRLKHMQVISLVLMSVRNAKNKYLSFIEKQIFIVLASYFGAFWKQVCTKDYYHIARESGLAV